MGKKFFPVFHESDFVNLPNHHIYLRLMIDGFTSKAFSASTMPPPQKEISHKEKIIALSREKYARKRKVVEMEIAAK